MRGMDRTKRRRGSRKAGTVLALPSGLKFDDISWEPTWEEKALDWNRQQLALALAAVKQIELEEQRIWLEAATRRMAAVALEIDQYKRKAALQEEVERQDKWWADVAVCEKAQTEALMAHYQEILDMGVFEKMKARAEKAKASMVRDNARIERLALLKRGVVKGRRG